MFANNKVVEQACKSTQDCIDLIRALGASVQDSMFKVGQLNRGFVEGLAAVKGPNELLEAQADYLQKCSRVAQETVLNLTMLGCEGAAAYWGRVNSSVADADSQAVEPGLEAETKAAADSAAGKEDKPQAGAGVKPETEVAAKAAAKPQAKAAAPELEV